MNNRINSTTRSLAKWAALPAIAMAALLAGQPAAMAWDQQATSAQMDNELNWQAATGRPTGAYAQAFRRGPDQGPVYVHHHRSDR